MTRRERLTAVVACVAFLLAGAVGTIAFFTAADAGDTADDAAADVASVRVVVEAKTCGQGNPPACDRICQSLTGRLVIRDDSGQRFEVSCKSSRKAAAPETLEDIDPTAPPPETDAKQGDVGGDTGTEPIIVTPEETEGDDEADPLLTTPAVPLVGKPPDACLPPRPLLC